ncbi:ferritin-like domain-containing protein [Sorangium sp. So ce1000]|uniref:ferritin-like domain-containing protein n=1 Tax=Sorangium sp. So ce1000 TaxID=3133325 RepID=UPI003F63FCDB
MIELATDDPVLARFVRDLDGQASIALEDGASAGPELARYTAEDIEHAQLAWSHRVMGEYRGVVIYTELLSALIEAEAPYPALAAVHRIIGDELRHTRLCAEVVGWLGGWESLHLDLGGQRMPRTDDPPAARALEIAARELTLVEEESVRTLRAYVRATAEPSIRRVFESLLRDEVRHAAAGRSLVELLERSYPEHELATVKARLRARLPEERRHLREQALARAVGGPGRQLGARLLPGDFEEHSC